MKGAALGRWSLQYPPVPPVCLSDAVSASGSPQIHNGFRRFSSPVHVTRLWIPFAPGASGQAGGKQSLVASPKPRKVSGALMIVVEWIPTIVPI